MPAPPPAPATTPAPAGATTPAASGASSLEEYMILPYISIALAITYLAPIVMQFIYGKKGKWFKFGKDTKSMFLPEKST